MHMIVVPDSLMIYVSATSSMTRLKNDDYDQAPPQLGLCSAMRRQQLRPLGSASNTKQAVKPQAAIELSKYPASHERAVRLHQARNKLSDYFSRKPTIEAACT